MKKLTAKQREEIETLVKLPDSQIDTSDIPEAIFTDQAVVGKFYRSRNLSPSDWMLMCSRG